MHPFLTRGFVIPWLLVISSIVTMLCLIFGAVLISKGRKDEDKKERNRQRHWEKVKKGGK